VATTVGTLAVGAVGYLQTSNATAAARTDARTSELMVQTEATQHTASVILAVAYMIGQPMPADRRQEMVDMMVEHADELSAQRDFIAEASVNADVDAKNVVLLPKIDALLASSAELAELPKSRCRPRRSRRSTRSGTHSTWRQTRPRTPSAPRWKTCAPTPVGMPTSRWQRS
jgi:hypothetical protein